MTRLHKYIQHFTRTIGALTVIMLTVQPASACRVFLGAEERVSSAYRRGDVTAVLLVHVEQATYTREQLDDAHPWQATAATKRLLWGTYSGSQVSFHGGESSAACDLGYSIPSAGDEWVVYISKMDGLVWIALPKQAALQADPSIRTR
jgi:hypothetical protein